MFKLRRGVLTFSGSRPRHRLRSVVCRLFGHEWEEGIGSLQIKLDGGPWERVQTEVNPHICSRCDAVQPFKVYRPPSEASQAFFDSFYVTR